MLVASRSVMRFRRMAETRPLDTPKLSSAGAHRPPRAMIASALLANS
jgi:hypothetical protein